VFNTSMDMDHSSSDNLAMNIMWILMGAMVVVDFVMVIYHSKLHKRINALEKQLNDKK